MRIASWDSADPAMVFDNPNLRWGSPAYLLEPGDPGYVPPANSVSEPKTKGKKMKRQDYYPSQQAKQVAWLYNLANKLPGQATALGLGSTQVAAIQADCLWLAFLIQTWLPEVRTWAQGCTQTLNEAQTGTGTAVQTLPAFAAPALPPAAPPLPATVPVAPGALTRIFAVVQVIKSSGKCTNDIAKLLDLIGPEAPSADLTTIQPVLTLKLVAGHVAVGWDFAGFSKDLDGVKILVDRADGKGAVLLTIDTTPGYTDTQPLPAIAAKWTYTAIYRVNDEDVGQWSAPVSITVGG